jgi:hypothetical protein
MMGFLNEAVLPGRVRRFFCYNIKAVMLSFVEAWWAGLCGYDKWCDKARELNARMHSTRFTVNDYLLRTATPQERQRGIDIADRWIDELLQQWEIEKEWGLR